MTAKLARAVRRVAGSKPKSSGRANAARKLRAEGLLRVVGEWEAAHGALTETALRAAERKTRRRRRSAGPDGRSRTRGLIAILAICLLEACTVVSPDHCPAYTVAVDGSTEGLPQNGDYTSSEACLQFCDGGFPVCRLVGPGK